MIPKTLASYTDKIADVWRDPDTGAWDISLRRGWICTATETHGIVEQTLREVANKCQYIEKCNCTQCAK